MNSDLFIFIHIRPKRYIDRLWYISSAFLLKDQKKSLQKKSLLLVINCRKFRASAARIATRMRVRIWLFPRYRQFLLSPPLWISYRQFITGGSVLKTQLIIQFLITIKENWWLKIYFGHHCLIIFINFFCTDVILRRMMKQ